MNITTVRQSSVVQPDGTFMLRVTLAGRYFRLLETVNPVTVRLGSGGKAYETLENVEAGAWSRLKAGDRDFDIITITTTTAESVKFVITDGEAGYDRLFVAIAQALTLALPGNVTVGVAEGAVLAAGSRRKVVFRSDPANTGQIYLGPVGVTISNAPICLEPGDIWVEEVASSAQWRGISSLAAQTLRVMTAT